MDPKIDGRAWRSKGKEKEGVFDDDVDVDLSDAADKMLKAVLAYSFSTNAMEIRSVLNKPRLDTQGNWSSCSRFQAFSKKYKSEFYKFMERLSERGIYTGVDPFHGAKTCRVAMLDDEDVFRRYKDFKRFDTVVVDFSDHLFSTSPMGQAKKPSEAWAERIREEWRLLEQGLPETIFVRVYESRMDLLRAVIIGPKGTPYHDGLFFFDVYIPSTFPLQPPVVRYRSGGFGGINPHLFACGEVRLDITFWSCLNPTLLRLLLSIQNRVLNADPLFHQPGFLHSGPSLVAEYFSLLYNEEILIKSLKTMMYIMTKPPVNFEDLVVGHFRNRAPAILMACKAYREGLLQAGRFVRNKEEESYCSIEFRNDVDICAARLVYYFNKIGATEASKFSLLSAPTPISKHSEMDQPGKNSPISRKPDECGLSVCSNPLTNWSAINNLLRLKPKPKRGVFY
ncbi:putative ubiquitin-conjugating enzyme E2, ubiquitin-conjugating enzyme/RWD [Helianthus anomalus]